jgi:hypothetical protein
LETVSAGFGPCGEPPSSLPLPLPLLLPLPCLFPCAHPLRARGPVASRVRPGGGSPRAPPRPGGLACGPRAPAAARGPRARDPCTPALRRRRLAPRPSGSAPAPVAPIPGGPAHPWPRVPARPTRHLRLAPAPTSRTSGPTAPCPDVRVPRARPPQLASREPCALAALSRAPALPRVPPARAHATIVARRSTFSFIPFSILV